MAPHGLDDLPTYHAYAGPSARVNAPLVLRYYELVIHQQQQRRQLIHGFELHGIPQAHADLHLLSHPNHYRPHSKLTPSTRALQNTVGANAPARTGEGPLPLSMQMAAVCVSKCRGSRHPGRRVDGCCWR
jgi:hypothetical protein